MKLEIRSDFVHIEGYVNAVERDSNVINVPSVGQCVEQIRAGAFGQALRDGVDVDILENHNFNRKLGSIAEGNLKLSEDTIGLRAVADIYDNDIIDKARRGLIKGWSFGFVCKDDKVENRADNVPRRIVNALELKEVSLIDGNMTPCYVGTLVEVRGQELVEIRDFVDDEIETVDETAEGTAEEERAKPDYSYYDAVMQLLEMRYNPYHDPSNGRFTSGGGGGGAIVIKKGDKSYKEDSKKYGRKVAALAHSDKSLSDLDKEIDSLKAQIAALEEPDRQKFLTAYENLKQQIKDTYNAKIVRRRRNSDEAAAEAKEQEKARQQADKEYEEEKKRRLSDWSGGNVAVGSSRKWQSFLKQEPIGYTRAEVESGTADDYV